MTEVVDAHAGKISLYLNVGSVCPSILPGTAIPCRAETGQAASGRNRPPSGSGTRCIFRCFIETAGGRYSPAPPDFSFSRVNAYAYSPIPFSFRDS
jgi:hypothetical protein